MMLQDRLVPGLGVDVGVDFGGEDGLVAQHFLDDAEVGTVFQEVGGEGVAEGVGRDFLPDAGCHGLVFYHIKYRDAAEGLAEAVQEEDVFVLAFGGGRSGGEVGADGIGRNLSQGYEALFVAFADDIHEAIVQVHVRKAEAGGFGDTQAAAVQHFQDGAVAGTEGRLQVHGFQNGRDFGLAQHGRKVLTQFGRVYPVAGVLLHLALFHAPVEKAPQGAKKTCSAALGEAIGRHLAKVGRDLGRCHRPGRTVHVLEEALHVVAVGCHRVG